MEERTVQLERQGISQGSHFLSQLIKMAGKRDHLRLFLLFNNTERLLFNLIFMMEVWECIFFQRGERRKNYKGCLKIQKGEWK